MKSKLFGLCCLLLFSNVDSEKMGIKDKVIPDPNLYNKEVITGKYDSTNQDIKNQDMKYIEGMLCQIPYFEYAKDFYGSYTKLPVTVSPDMTKVYQITGIKILFKKRF